MLYPQDLFKTADRIISNFSPPSILSDWPLNPSVHFYYRSHKSLIDARRLWLTQSLNLPSQSCSSRFFVFTSSLLLPRWSIIVFDRFVSRGGKQLVHSSCEQRFLWDAQFSLSPPFAFLLHYGVVFCFSAVTSGSRSVLWHLKWVFFFFVDSLHICLYLIWLWEQNGVGFNFHVIT